MIPNIIVTTLIFIVSVIMNIYGSMKSKKIAESRLKFPYEPLPDIIHDYTSKIDIHIPDYMLFVVFFFAIIKLYTVNTINIYLNILSYTYSLFLRSMTVSLTIMPTCVPKPIKQQHNIYQRMFISTHDLMFSGHTLLFIFLGKIIEECYDPNIILYIIGMTTQFLLPFLFIQG